MKQALWCNALACMAVAFTLLWMAHYALSLPDVSVDSVTGECLEVTFADGTNGDCNEVGYTIRRYNLTYAY